MVSFKSIISEAEHNRKKCYFCGKNIKKGTKYMIIGVSAWNNQLSTRGVCRVCIAAILEEMTQLQDVIEDAKKNLQ